MEHPKHIEISRRSSRNVRAELEIRESYGLEGLRCRMRAVDVIYLPRCRSDAMPCIECYSERLICGISQAVESKREGEKGRKRGKMTKSTQSIPQVTRKNRPRQKKTE